MLSIYNYTEVHKFLKDSWQKKKKKNPAFSMSAWAKQLGLENSSPLSLAFKGKRSLPKKYIPEMIRSLDLNYDEGIFLEALVDLSKAKTPEQKLFYLSRLKELAPVSVFENSTVEEYKFMSDPLHSAIIEMTDLKGFNSDPRWIKNKLAIPCTLEEVIDAVQRLVELNLLKEEPRTEKLSKSHQNLTTEDEVADLATQNYHRSACELASLQVLKDDVSMRDFNSFAFNMKSKDLPKAKQRIDEFLNKFFDEFEAPAKEADHTFKLNTQLFRVTK